MIEKTEHQLDRLLPFNTSELEQTLEQVHAQRLVSIPLPISTLWNPEHCPEPLLPWLAWAFSVENWESDWPVEIKRDVIASSVAVHRQKGTLASIRRVLNALRIHFEIKEWFEYGGEPHTFRLTTSANEQWVQGIPAADTTDFTRLREVVDSVKPVRSHYRMVVSIEMESHVAIGNQSSIFSVLRLSLAPVVKVNSLSQMAVANSLLIPMTVLTLTVDLNHGESLLAPQGLSSRSVVSLTNLTQGVVELKPVMTTSKPISLRCHSSFSMTAVLSTSLDTTT